MATQILRLEHLDGFGIFRNHDENGNYRDYQLSHTSVDDDICRRHNNLPIPQDDIGIADQFEEGSHFCAYKSISQFYEWIQPNEFKELHEHGIRAYLITVSECIIGALQVVYKKEDIISKHDVSSLFL